ncbi:hypothetical protein BJF90_44250 [Pseudonocardia sp. CNS-004]|nr:hypothetical protein BJF90_44250 [Pseudonocardia sp. CNS-004]
MLCQFFDPVVDVVELLGDAAFDVGQFAGDLFEPIFDGCETSLNVVLRAHDRFADRRNGLPVEYGVKMPRMPIESEG